jgi:excisionase family DNA binding protein
MTGTGPPVISPIPTTTATAVLAAKRRRGRPKGSRNKPRPQEAEAPVKPAALRVQRAAQYLSVSQSTIRRLIAAGELEVRRHGGLLLVLVRSLDAWLERGT